MTSNDDNRRRRPSGRARVRAMRAAALLVYSAVAGCALNRNLPSAARSAAPPGDAVAPSATAGAQTTDSQAGTPPPPTELEITRPDADNRVFPVRVVNYRNMWEAVAALDDQYATTLARSPEEKRFAKALALQMDGALPAAEAAFASLAHNAADSSIRRRAVVARIAILQAQDDWHALAAASRDASVRAELSSVDRAGVLSWAEAFMTLPPERYEIPREGVRVPLIPNPLGAPAVEVTINGKRYSFWLDTGSTLTLLASDVAAELGVAPIGTDTLLLVTAVGRIDAQPAVLDSMEIADARRAPRHLRVTSQRIAIVSEHDLRLVPGAIGSNGVPVRLAGVLGAAFLRHTDLRLDMPDRTATFYPTGTPARGSARTLHWVGYPVVRLLSAGGTPLVFGFDTGADTSYAAAGIMEKFPQVTIRRDRAATLRGFGETERSTTFVLAALAVELAGRELRFRNLIVDRPRHAGIVRLDGILGRDVVSRMPFRIDLGAGILAGLVM